MDKTKKCNKCKIEKFLSEFWRNVNNKNGYCNFCIDCMKKQHKIWLLKNPNKMKKLNQEWAKKNRAKRRQYKKQYRQQNLIRIRQYEKNYRAKKIDTDINFKIACNLRSRIKIALKKNYKNSSTIELLDCSIGFLKRYIEKQFKKSMTWKNWGRGWYNKQEWHIDHIKPCASFDLSKLEAQRKCFNYKNLQPLWAEENRNKGKEIRK